MAGLGAFLASAGAVARGVHDGMKDIGELEDLQSNREFIKRVRETGVKRMDAEDSLMADKTAADRAKLGVSRARDTADAELLPGDTALKRGKQKIDQQTQDWQLGHLGKFLDVKNNELGTALSTSKAAMQKAAFDLEMLPQQVAKARAAQTIDGVQTTDMLLGGLGHALTIGDKGVAKKYVQGVADSGIFPQLKGATVGDIGTMPGPDGKTLFVVSNAEGQPLLALPGAKITEAYSRLNPAKYQVLPDGGSLLKITKDGVVQAANNPKDLKPEDRLANEDKRFSRGKGVIDSYFGANSLNKLDDANQPFYIQSTARMGELVRGGMEPEKAAAQAIEETKRSLKLGGAGGAAAPAAPAAGSKPFTPWK